MTSDVDRRRFLQTTGVAAAATGAAWVAPSVLGTSSAFAAGSNCPQNSTLAFVSGMTVTPYPTGNGNGISGTPANNNGWAFAQANMTGTDALGVFANYHAPPPNVPQFVVERNPNTGSLSGASVTYTHALGTLSSTTTYTFSSQTFSVKTNQYTQLLQVQILNAGGTVVSTLGSYRTDSSNSHDSYSLLSTSWTTQTWNFKPSSTATYQFRFTFTFDTPGTGADTGGNNGVGDDIAVTAPTVTCA